MAPASSSGRGTCRFARRARSGERPAGCSRCGADRLDRCPFVGERANGLVGLLATQKAFVLDALGAGQERRVNLAGADRLTDRAHRFPHGVEERAARVLHQMPAIGDLPRFGQRPANRLAISAAAITRDDANVGPCRESGFDGRGFAVRQHVDDAPPLEIADGRSIPVPALPSPIIDSDDTLCRRLFR